ncbi:serine hydrolase domain-containing protein [Roseococcus pinisoli]|uniref:Serine hydrolase n=1 Tax=Roseococcus pinisoli TaxID=2835040 RepID=A0ABS5QDG3_9PROT|nr:serine hydrolase [Roseococcus pinisoli]MBS7811735.1 serine hydrolase [Roseococcus pinisoli]
MSLRRSLLAGSILVGGAAATVVAANLGIGLQRYGPTYLRRTLTRRWIPDLRDPEYFPARPIRAADRAFLLPVDPDGPEHVEAAFASIAGRHGASGETLDGFLARTRSTSLLVLHRDRLIRESYANGASDTSLLTSMSMAKSVLSLLVVAAIADGYIPSLDVQAETLLPDIGGLRGTGITLRHLMHMVSGLRFENPRPLGWLSWEHIFDGERVSYLTPDIVSHLATARAGQTPGSHFSYDDRSAQLVGLAIERATGRTVSAWLEERLWRRIGTEAGATWVLDRKGGHERMESGINARARDWLRLGRLVLREGDWEGTAVLPRQLVREVTHAPQIIAGLADPISRQPEYAGRSYGLFWWGLVDEPQDCLAEGALGQVLYVARSHDAVLLRTGGGTRDVPSWATLLRDLAAALPA